MSVSVPRGPRGGESGRPPGRPDKAVCGAAPDIGGADDRGDRGRERRASPLSGFLRWPASLGGIAIDINQVGILLLGSVLGWFLLFAVRRYKVQWGAFATFFVIGFGVSLISWLYAKDLLAYYGIGIFLGFVANMVVRFAGIATGGKLGEGLLEISAFRSHEK
jgi:hypothetical protein